MTDYNYTAARSARSCYALLDEATREELRKLVRNEDKAAYQAQLAAASRRRREGNANAR